MKSIRTVLATLMIVLSATTLNPMTASADGPSAPPHDPPSGQKSNHAAIPKASAQTTPQETPLAAPMSDTAEATASGPALGQFVENEEIALTVSAWRTMDRAGHALPTEGNRFVAVDIIAVNIDRTTTYVDSRHFAVTAGEMSYTYSEEATRALEGFARQPSDLATGERARFTLVFELPERPQPLALVFAPIAREIELLPLATIDEETPPTAAGLGMLWNLFAGSVDVAILVSDAATNSPEPGTPLATPITLSLGEHPAAVSTLPAPLAIEQRVNVVAAGTAVEDENLRLQVNGMRDVPGSGFHPDDGYRFVAVELTVTNLTDEEISLFAVSSQLELVNTAGDRYRHRFPSHFIDIPEPSRGVRPNETLTYNVIYEIPNTPDSYRVRWQYEFDAPQYLQVP